MMYSGQFTLNFYNFIGNCRNFRTSRHEFSPWALYDPKVIAKVIVIILFLPLANVGISYCCNDNS